MIHEVPPSADYDSAPGNTDFSGWETVRSQHFVLHTDAGLGAIKEVITRFEDTYEALRATLFQAVEAPAVEALVFADAADYRAVAGNGAGKFLQGVGATGSLLVVRHNENAAVLERVVAHELAHRFTRALHPALPNWLSEGIAEYLETVEVRDDEVLFGTANRTPDAAMQVGGGVTFTALVRVTPEQLYGNEAQFFYAAAWALVHHLMNGKDGELRPRFGQLLLAVEQATRQRQSAERAFAEVYPDITVAEWDQVIDKLSRSLGRPGVNVVLPLPFQRPPLRPIERRAADGQQLRLLVAEVQRRNWQPPESVVDLGARPNFARLEAQLAFHRGYFGMGFGRMFRAPFAWDAAVGIGPLGYELAALGRAHVNVGEGGNFFVSAGLGPMAAFKSESLGNQIVRHMDVMEKRRGLYYFLGVNPEFAAEIRTPSNVVVRLSVGAYLRLAENLSQLCAPPRSFENAPRCPDNPRGGKSDASIARDGYLVFARLGLGYSW